MGLGRGDVAPIRAPRRRDRVHGSVDWRCWTGDDILTYLKDTVSKQWLPGAIDFAGEQPHTTTGMASKIHPCERVKDDNVPSPRPGQGA